MFIEKHVDTITGGKTPGEVALAFLKSAEIQAYPCGRRRSEEIGGDSNRFPFDPEARLNTEANNRKHSGLNGYTQTYLNKWDTGNKHLSLALAGYLFDIQLDTLSEPDTFGKALISALKSMADSFITAAGTDTEAITKAETLKAEINAAEHIYANVVIEDVDLFIGFQNYHTGILRNQSGISIDLPEGFLDLLVPLADKTKSENYYFSGLSFSTEAFTTDPSHEEPVSFKRTIGNTEVDVSQTLVSLCILEKVEGVWKVYEPAKLPSIKHGNTKDSVEIGELIVNKDITVTNNVTAGSLDSNAATIGDITAESITVTDGAEGGTLSAASVVATTIAGNDSITTPTANVTAYLNVANAITNDALATIDEAYITTATIETLEVTNLKATGIIELGAIDVTGIGADDNKVENIYATNASIDNLTSSSITTTDINGTDIKQKIDNTDKYYSVPVIAIKNTDKGYQLQISKVNVLQNEPAE
jgi:hypothetical protein